MQKTVTPLVNTALPMIMHVDLNSCFAIIEQQANRLLRGRPVGVAAYDTPRGFVLAASYEAKAKGIKLGLNVQQARSLVPEIVIMTPDPAKYRTAHQLFKKLMLEYTPDVSPKSIDEFVLNIQNSPVLRGTKKEILKTSTQDELILHNKAMLAIGEDMKNKIRQRLGEWVTVNIGIGPNRFLAKYAAGFDKPDGMTLIDPTNLKDYYKGMKLVDLPGINTRYRKRLREYRIYSPLDFLDADVNVLKKQVFKSIVGYYWYLRLRGHEIDATETVQRKTIGHQHALSNKTTNIIELERLLMKLSEKVGRRLRKNNLCAQGIHLYIGFASSNPLLDETTEPDLNSPKKWHHGQKLSYTLYSTFSIYNAAKKILHQAEIVNRVRVMSVDVYDLISYTPKQLSLFEPSITLDDKEHQLTKQNLKIIQPTFRTIEAKERLSDCVDRINNRYGEFVITPACILNMQGTVLDRIAFGSIKDILY